MCRYAYSPVELLDSITPWTYVPLGVKIFAVKRAELSRVTGLLYRSLAKIVNWIS